MGRRYVQKGPESDVVISSRVRLARNFKDYPFPFRMNKAQSQEVLGKIKDAVFKSSNALVRELSFVEIDELEIIDKQALVEKHLISPDMVANKKSGGVIISNDEKISILINEEDHLRIQCLFSGMQIENAWKLCNKIDTILDKRIDFAFNNDYGYLTCCPTNLGTGIRVSVMLHLPALVMTGYINKILEACSKLGVAVRGIFGENSEASGNMFQFSNQVSLGQTEEEMISSIKNVASQIIEQERNLRNQLYKQNPFRFEDTVHRSLGILSSARIISSEESLKLLSDVRLGVDIGIIKNINIETLNEIMLLIQSANLQKFIGKTLNEDERDIKRAQLIRGKLQIMN